MIPPASLFAHVPIPILFIAADRRAAFDSVDQAWLERILAATFG